MWAGFSVDAVTFCDCWAAVEAARGIVDCLVLGPLDLYVVREGSKSAGVEGNSTTIIIRILGRVMPQQKQNPDIDVA